MLSISAPMKGSGRGNYYLELAKEDYYANRAEEPGRWLGQGAEYLGLVGTVQPDSFRNLLDGFTPDKHNVFVQNAGNPNRQSGWDLTFSAPKSVSVLWALSPEVTRNQIEQAHHEAVTVALKYIEQTAGVTRRGPGGSIKEPAALFFATFQHGTSRDQDPQLHTHAVLINLGLRQDGTTGTLQSRNIFREKMAGGAVYQAELAAALRRHLNVVIEPDKVGFHIRGVPRELCREFSRRRRAIEKVLAERGADNAVAAKVAALDTRTTKTHVPRGELFARWQQVGEAYGWSANQVVTTQQPEHDRAAAEAVFREELRKALAALPPKQQTRGREVRLANRLAIQHGADARALLKELRPPAKTPGFLRVEWQPLFPKAPSWSPAKRFTVPVVVIGRNAQRPRPWGKVLWKQNLVLGELRIQQRRVFPRAPQWSPARHLQLPTLRLAQKSPDWAPLKPPKDMHLSH